MDSTTKGVRVSINLSDVDCLEPFPDRIVSLFYPDFSIAVGRGSLSDDAIEPRPDNAYFSSRVMSRQHATIRADPETRILTIQDDGSMHGTSLNGGRVGKDPLELLPADILTFGTEVVRGEDTYPPLKMSIHFEWEDEEDNQDISSKNTEQTSFRNKFTVDFSEEDFDSEYDDDGAQIVKSSVRESSVEILYPPSCYPNVTRPAVEDHQPKPVTPSKKVLCVYDGKRTLLSESLSYEAEYDDDEEDGSVLERPCCETQDDDLYEDNDDAELDSDSLGSESSFIDHTDKEEAVTQATMDIPAMQPAPLSAPSTLSSDSVGREPSPSDAALARPRATDLSIASLVEETPASALPSTSEVKTISNPYGNYDINNVWVGTQNHFRGLQVAQPVHNYVTPYPYNRITTPVHIGSMGTYSSSTPAHPWRDQWSSTLPSYRNQQFPSPPSMVPHRQTQTKSSDATRWESKTTADPKPQTKTLASSSDSIRGQKRKADAISEYSDDNSVASDRLSTARDPFGSSSPIVTQSSPATNVSLSSVEAEKFVLTTSEEDEKDDEAFAQDQPTSSNELNQILDNLLQPTEPVGLDFQSTAKASTISEPVNEPPRKKVKGNNGKSANRQSRASTAIKYTVTALAGVTLGALGTVVGLASLPVDYFV